MRDKGRIILRKGDLFRTGMPIVAHGVNASNGFGSGVAAQVAHLFPDVKKAYHDKFASEGWEVGEMQCVAVKSGPPSLQYVANLCTQREYGRTPGRVYVDYGGLEEAVDSLLLFAEASELGVAMPRIGAGLAGGDWNRILRIVRECVRPKKVVVEIWEMEQGGIQSRRH